MRMCGGADCQPAKNHAGCRKERRTPMCPYQGCMLHDMGATAPGPVRPVCRAMNPMSGVPFGCNRTSDCSRRRSWRVPQHVPCPPSRLPRLHGLPMNPGSPANPGLPVNPPEVRQQANDEGSRDVQQQPGAKHFTEADAAGGIGNGVGRGGDGQQEGAGGTTGDDGSQ